MSDRIFFANTLRGFAAVLVLLSHFLGVFWIMNPGVTSLLGAPVLKELPALPWLGVFFSEFCVVFGQFGVGVFFIISGLVVPFSLEKDSRWRFIFRRVLRIYPVYIAGFSLSVLGIYILSIYLGEVFIYSAFDIFSHFGIVTRAIFGVYRIDGISWTLEVELFFYIFLFVFGCKVLDLRLGGYVLAIFLSACGAALTFLLTHYLLGVQVAAALLLILGLAYRSLMRNKIKNFDFAVINFLVVVSLCILWFFFAQKIDYVYQWLCGYVIAIVFFFCCFCFRDHFKGGGFLSHLADISYPLYVVHALLGYSVMYVLIDLGMGAIGTIFFASVVSYAAALLIHVVIEKPVLNWSKTVFMSNLQKVS